MTTSRILKFFHSSRLALVLLLLLALLAVPGTLLEREAAGSLYGGPLFLVPAGMLCLNIALCSWHRFSLRRASFSSHSTRRKRVAWLDLAMHASIILLLAGGLGKGLWGSIGTQYLFVGVETDMVYDWEAKEDVPLGFSINLKERVEEFYPLRIRVGVKDAASGEKVALLELQEGKEAGLPGGDLNLRVEQFDGATGLLMLSAAGEDRREIVPLSLQDEERREAIFGPYRLTLVAFKRVLKKVRGRLIIVDDGVEVKDEWLAVNSRVAYGGTSIFQTSWGEDAYGNPFIGVQVARDPAAPLFWAGCVLFCLTLPLFFTYRHFRQDGES